MASPVYDTIVVGMGAAGTTALSTLARAGKSVLGLEGADYVGGRVRTVEFGDGVVEVGAEWIHGEKPSCVYDLAVANNIPIVKQDIDTDVYRSDGTKGDTALMNELLGFCVDIIDNPPVVSEPIGQYITKRLKEYLSDRPSILADEEFMDGFLAFMNHVVNNYESSNDWNDVSTASKYTPLEGHQHWSWREYGYRTFFDILLNKHNNGTGLKADILLNKEVDNIEWSKEPTKEVIVKCKDGATFKSKNVIVTVSLGVLKHRYKTLFTPSLPEQKINAVNDLTMGVMGKIILKFDRHWWANDTTISSFLWKPSDRSKVAKEDEWSTLIYGFSRPMGSKNCLTIWTAGEAAKHVETLSDDVVKRKVMAVVRRFMGKTHDIPEPSGIIRSYWYTNPLTCGSYTFDSMMSQRNPEARQQLAAPVLNEMGSPVLMFAGEATNEFHFSTVHGASETGSREADRLLQDGVKLKSKM